MPKQHKHLPRLPDEYYRGQAYVHWTMTMRDRQTGWLIPIFYYKFRELLTHTMFRYGLTCPIYCCMPDHLTCFGLESSISPSSGLPPNSFASRSTPFWKNLARSFNDSLTITCSRKKNANMTRSNPWPNTSPEIQSDAGWFRRTGSANTNSQAVSCLGIRNWCPGKTIIGNDSGGYTPNNVNTA